ncbi:MAG TPA: bile acid:sodium symporter [Longimicrobiales bacterium]
MTAVLSTLLDLSVIVFAVASMLSVGLGQTVRQILSPLRNVGAVIRAVIANFVLVPLLALLVLRVIPVEQPLAIGLFLVAAAAGTPFLIKLVEAAGSDVPLSGSLLVLLLPLTIIYMPIVVPLALPEAQVGPDAIARPLVFTLLVPLAIGLLVRRQYGRWAHGALPFFQKTSTIALVVLILSTILVNLEGILEIFGTGAILAAAIIIGGAFGIGFLLGAPGRAAREVLALGTGQRNIAAAMVVASEAVEIPGTMSMVVVASLIGLLILFVLAALLRRRGRKREAPGRQDEERRKAA